MIPRLKTRAEFVHVATGRRWSGSNVTLQAAPRRAMPTEVDAGAPDAAPDLPRLGFTVTKKIGGAVVRNRVRRRLKSAVDASAERLIGEGLAKAGHDYVIVARAPALATPFTVLIDEIAAAFAGVHRARSSAKASIRAAHGPRPENASPDQAATPVSIPSTPESPRSRAWTFKAGWPERLPKTP